jgi:hypothetical protein
MKSQNPPQSSILGQLSLESIFRRRETNQPRIRLLAEQFRVLACFASRRIRWGWSMITAGELRSLTLFPPRQREHRQWLPLSRCVRASRLKHFICLHEVIIMDVSKVLVLVLMLVAFGFLVWFEMNSRKNTRAAQQVENQANSPEKSAKA